MGFDARAVQQRLADAGWYHDTVDGGFGKRSFAALFSCVARRELGDRGLAIGAACVGALRDAEIIKPLQIAHFISQTATETGAFKNLSEDLNYSAKGLMRVWPSRFPTMAATDGFVMNAQALANKVYAGRLGNGNAASGDGWKYRGRGLIQLTGRDNYAQREAETAIPLVTNPELASDPATSVKIACLYWVARSINTAADADDIVKVRKMVNGGSHGIDDARIYLKRAKAVLI
jgi:putative chitinase